MDKKKTRLMTTQKPQIYISITTTTTTKKRKSTATKLIIILFFHFRAFFPVQQCLYYKMEQITI